MYIDTYIYIVYTYIYNVYIHIYLSYSLYILYIIYNLYIHTIFDNSSINRRGETIEEYYVEFLYYT